jgi:hypothetical protein
LASPQEAETMSKKNDGDDLARAMAANAMMVVQAYGTLFEAFLGALRDNNILSPAVIKAIFLGAAAAVDEQQPTNDAQRQAQMGMRNVIAHVASGHGIQIPPPGQTGMPKRY